MALTFFSSTRSALIHLAFSPSYCLYRRDIFVNRVLLIFWLTLSLYALAKSCERSELTTFQGTVTQKS